MARDQEPMTSEVFDVFQGAMDDQAEELHEALAADIGESPEDHRKRLSADGRNVTTSVANRYTGSLRICKHPTSI